MTTKASSKKDKFCVACYCILIGTDIQNIKQYILSTNKDTIEPPYFYISKNDLSINIENRVVEYMQDLIAISEIELSPQLITLHTNLIPTIKNQINTVYAFVCNITENINADKVHWVPFNYQEYNTYSHLIAEITRKLK